ncbi:MAG: LicD family protein [Parcubacteria group bacterium ADurb.Bin216]|nr:MAG: LicD family protein [Parcubacteria group bacterium ADurb.Bin216]
MDKKSAIQNLLQLKDIFPNMFLCYGTALGSIREGDILTHDLDTDIGILASDFS